ncbi:MAG TPA: hypothetical protein VI757_03340 [Bacteroidia bacterium]|nr:hypothetical protein [Bacteroidia bacterium]
MSEGEDFIKDFFLKNKIIFRPQQPIDGLKGDSKNHRIADFYLPQYRVYVEYFGQFNVESHKERYREKKNVYLSNDIPCVILYPENLGIIEYIFAKRIIYVLKRYKMEPELRKYRWKKFKKEKGENIFYAGLFLFFIAGSFSDINKYQGSLLVFSLLFLFQVFILQKSYRKIFNEE